MGLHARIHPPSASQVVHVSLNWASTLEPVAPDDSVVQFVFESRSISWNRSRIRRSVSAMCDFTGCLLRARRARAASLVVCTIGFEVVLLVLLRALFAPRMPLIVVDPIVSASMQASRAVGWALRRVAHVVCIRSEDRVLLTGTFCVEPSRITFCKFPAPTPAPHLSAPHVKTPGERFIYAGGRAQRDWPTLVRALAEVGEPAVVTTEAFVDAPSNIDFVGVVSPETGRAFLDRATVVVLPLADTTISAGPLVLLDAMSRGKAIVATDVAGNRDYVQDGETALVVPPRDPDAMANAITRLMAEPGLRRRLGDRARDVARQQTPTAFWRCVGKVILGEDDAP